ncbi:hypothetical protein, partial [Enterococcus entomosocium]|uniref:hypothetical protein n=1 Tax=Enterococcus entomosocium TaxID=3034352 RepID=UPI002648AD39
FKLSLPAKVLDDKSPPLFEEADSCLDILESSVMKSDISIEDHDCSIIADAIELALENQIQDEPVENTCCESDGSVSPILKQPAKKRKIIQSSESETDEEKTVWSDSYTESPNSCDDDDMSVIALNLG